MREVISHWRVRRRLLVVAALLAGSTAMALPASAEGLLDFLFGGLQQLQQRATQPQGSLTDPFGINPQPAPLPRATAGGSGPAYCVRSCDGRYFPLSRGNATPVQLCQAFCPASPTTVFYGSSIDNAASSSGEHYVDSENAYAYRKALRADCTCNGRDPAGLAPVDLALDTSLRPGDVIATSDGLLAFSGARVGVGQAAEFAPVASYPGLTPAVRARLGDMKVAPVSAETLAQQMPPSAASPTMVPRTSALPGKRAEAD